MAYFIRNCLKNGNSRFLAPLVMLAICLSSASCGVILGADGSNNPQSDIPTEYAEARAEISFDGNLNLILVNLETVNTFPKNRIPQFPCSIDIESAEISFDLYEGGSKLNFNNTELDRYAELNQSYQVPGVDSRIFAVWALPDYQRGDVIERTTVTIRDSEIVFRNDCQQGWL